MTNYHNENRISAGLTRFGLNPAEWSFESPRGRKSPIVIFQNKSDKKFQLIGRLNLNAKQPKLHDLQLFSI